MLEVARERARDRRLAGDARAGRRVRDEIRRKQWDFVRRNWSFLASGLAMGALVTTLGAVFAPSPFLRGAIIGGGIVFVFGGLAFTVVMITGTGPQSMGAVAETWTSSELRPLRKHGWKVIDHVFYRYADADHVLIGPAGAIVAETKWSGRGWSLDGSDSDLVRHVERLKKTARDVVLTTPELRHRDGGVRTVLFLWGGSRSDCPHPNGSVQINGVDVVYGTDAARVWRSRMMSVPALFDPNEISRIWTRLRTQAGRTDEQDASERPLPTLARLYWTTLATLLSVMLAAFGGSYAAQLPDGVAIGYLYVVVAATLGLAARRITWLRFPALGWLGGVAFVAALLVLAELG